MSNIFRDSESLGKSNWKKWSNIWTFLFWSGLKSARKKMFFFFCWFCLKIYGGNQASQCIWDLWSKGVPLILAYLLIFLSFCVLDDFFRFSKKSGFWVFLVHGFWVFGGGDTLLWHRCYYLHRLRYDLSPVCGIFFHRLVHSLDLTFYYIWIREE